MSFNCKWPKKTKKNKKTKQNKKPKKTPSIESTLMLTPEKYIKNQRKLQTSISHEHKRRSPQQNITKPNPAKYKKNYTPQLNGIYFMYARLMQHLNISPCNLAY